MKRSDVDKFEKLVGLLQGSYDEISLLSKKSPSDAVNKFKLRFINAVTRDCNDFLGAKYKPFGDFSEFSEDDVPQNSDVAFILAQYLRCFEKYKADNSGVRHGNWVWIVQAQKNEIGDGEGLIYIRTVKPKGLRE